MFEKEASLAEELSISPCLRARLSRAWVLFFEAMEEKGKRDCQVSMLVAFVRRNRKLVGSRLREIRRSQETTRQVQFPWFSDFRFALRLTSNVLIGN